MPDEDARIILARLEGMLNATLPQHSARLDEHDRAILNLAAGQTQHGQEIAALRAIQTAASRTPKWVGVTGVLLTGLAIVVTVLLFTIAK